jgi:hypothetical protein
MHQLNICWKQVFQTETIDGVRVAAAHFHKPVMPFGISQAADLVGRFPDDTGFAEFINKLHVSPRP